MNPRSVILPVIGEEIQKTQSLLLTTVGEFFEPDADAEKVVFCCMSIMGQILLQAHTRSPHAPPVVRLPAISAEEIERLTRHIVEFSLGGIMHVRAMQESAGKQ